MRSAQVEEPAARLRPERRGARIETLWMILAAGVPAIATFAGTVGAIDLAYHLRAGEISLETGAILRSNVMSFAEAGAPWLNQQWGAQVVLALFSRIGGLEALQVLQAGVIGGIAWLTFLSCRARGGSTRVSALLTIASVLLTMPTLAIRPQLFGILLFAATLYLLTVRASRPRGLWLLPAIAVVWANTHGSFALLPVLVALALIESRLTRRGDVGRLAAIGAASVLATLLNPFGFRVWVYVADLTTDPVIRSLITEWEPTSLGAGSGWAFFCSVGLVVLLLARRNTAVAWSDLLWLGVFFVLALGAIRATAWWALVVPVVAAGLLATEDEETDPEGPRLLNLAFILAIVGSGVLLLPWFRGVRLEWAPEQLVRATEKATVPGDRLIVTMEWGSWFEYRLPDRPVFVDPRIELYPGDVWADYLAIQRGRADWSGIVDRWRADALVVERDWAVLPFLRDHPGWRMGFENEDGYLFVRT